MLASATETPPVRHAPLRALPRVRVAAPARVPGAIRPAADSGIALGALAIVFLASSQTQPPLSPGELLLLRVSVLSLLLLAAFTCLWPYALGAWGVYDAARRPGWARMVAGTFTASLLVLAFTLPEGTFTLRSAVAFWDADHTRTTRATRFQSATYARARTAKPWQSWQRLVAAWPDFVASRARPRRSKLASSR